MDIYCTQLGMVIEFSYCMSMNDGFPCRNVIGCWEARMDIMGYLSERYSPEELERFFGGMPKSKIERILELLKDKRNETGRNNVSF